MRSLTDRPAIEPFQMGDVLRSALTNLEKQQSPDGWWRTLYLGGPLHTGSGLIATNLLAEATPARFEIEWALLEGILLTQQADGGVPAYPGGVCNRAVARVTELTCRLFLRSYASLMTPDQEKKITSAADAAKTFGQTAAKGGAFSELVANIIWNAIYDDMPDLPGACISAEAAALILSKTGSLITNRFLASFARQALPAISVLLDVDAHRSFEEKIGAKILDLVGLDPDRDARAACLDHILANQARTGGWLWSVFGTTLNLLALRALGRDRNDEHVRRGVAFIDGLRVMGPDKRLEQSWCNAEIWDSSVAGTTLIAAGMQPARIEDLALLILAEQQSDGLWAFGIGAIEGDNDSSSMALTFLTRAAKYVSPETRDRLEKSAIRCANRLMGAQQKDGGFGYSPEPYHEPYGFGRRLPFGLETALVDASTADVTGRVMTAMLATAATFGLESSSFTNQVEASVSKAVAFLANSQSVTGSWPGRWTAGYLSSLAFVLPSLRAFAPELVESEWVQRCRAFVLAHQNKDEGWGETTLADSLPQDAGEGASSPVQTAYAAIALIATSRVNDGYASVEAGVRYLNKIAQAGEWHNHNALFTVAFREDYFDAPFMTNAMVTSSLVYSSAALVLGADIATDLLVLG